MQSNYDRPEVSNVYLVRISNVFYISISNSTSSFKENKKNEISATVFWKSLLLLTSSSS